MLKRREFFAMTAVAVLTLAGASDQSKLDPRFVKVLCGRLNRRMYRVLNCDLGGSARHLAELLDHSNCEEVSRIFAQLIASRHPELTGCEVRDLGYSPSDEEWLVVAYHPSMPEVRDLWREPFHAL